MRPIYRKIYKTFAYTVLSLLLVVTMAFLGAMLYLKSEPGQAWLTKEANQRLSDALDRRVNIDSVKASFPSNINLHNAVVYDHKQDTLLATNKIGLKFSLYSLNLNSLIFANIHLDRPRFYGRKYKGDSTYNYQYVMENLQADESSDDAGIYRILFNGVQIDDGRFVLKNYHEPRAERDAIDFNYLDIKDLQVKADFLQIIEGGIISEIGQMSFRESSGFEVEQLKTDLVFDNSSLSFDNLTLKTPYSTIREQVTMEFESQEALSENFIEDVELITRFKNAHLSWYDLSYISPNIERVHKKVHFSGELQGSVDGFSSNDFRLAFGEKTYFDGSLSFRGLPDIDQTFMSLKFKESQFQTRDFKTLFPDLQLPIDLQPLGLVSFDGEFIGFPSDFVAYGVFNTALGEMKTDINLKNPTDEANAQYTGKLTLNQFDLGQLLGEPLLGQTSFEGKIDGKGLTLDHLVASLNADVSKIYVNDYGYQNIDVAGKLSKGLFKGDLTLKDPNADLDFKGTVNLDKPKPKFDFKADLQDADLHALNLVKDTLLLSTKANMSFKANNLDDVEGGIQLRDAQFSLSDRDLSFDSMSLNSVIRERNEAYKEINLNSDIADATIAGEFNPSSLGEIGKMTMKRLTSSGLVPGDTIVPVEENLNFNLHVKNAAFLMELMKTELVLENNTRIAGAINTESGDFSLNGTIPGIYYKEWFATNIRLSGSGSQNSIFVKSEVGELTKGDSVILANSNVNLLRKKDDSLQFNFNLARKDQQARILGKFKANDDKLVTRFYDSRLLFGDTTWNFQSGIIEYFYDQKLHIPILRFQNHDQRLTVTGKAGEGKATPLRILFDKIGLGTFTKQMFPEYSAYTGTIDGQVMVHDLFKKPFFNGGLMVSPLKVNQDALGNLNVSTNYNPESKNINLEAVLNKIKDQKELMNLSGYINLFKENNLNLKADFQETQFALVEGIVDDYISDLDGTFVSSLTIFGPFEAPQIDGYVNLNDAALTLNYLQTRYQVDHTVRFDRNKIPVNDLILKDENGNKAIANGVIKHAMFSDFNLDVTLQANNFKSLNTTESDNEIYFGEAYASGFVQFTGPLTNLTIDMQVKSEPNTVVNLPVTSESDYSAHDFIKFIDENEYFLHEYETDFGGINLNMEMEITEDAMVKIIFDPETGDILKGRGNGNIQMDITSAGNFKMYGGYTISSGDYNFTAFDIIKKQFQLKEGGTIKWNGDPYEAQMDIQAAYTLQASPAPLIPKNSEQSDALSRKMPVEAQLFLKGSLFSPDIDLDFEILNLEDNRSGGINQLSSQVRKIKNDEQAVNQQVVSLLVMNRFYSVRSGSGLGAGQALETSSNSLVGDLISNQLNYWVSQFSDDIKYLENVQLGVNYRGRNKTSTGEISQQELEVALSTTLFNDRVSITGSMDMQSSQGNIEVSYKITEEGRIRIKAFSRNNSNPILNENIQTHGTGVLWRKEFDSWEEFFSRDQKSEEQEAPEEEDSSPEPPASKKP